MCAAGSLLCAFHLPLHDFVLDWTLPQHGSFRYLGAHLKPNPYPGRIVHPRHLFIPAEKRSIYYRMHYLNQAFSFPSGHRLPEARLIPIAVKQAVLAALYSTPVVDVDYQT